ncbi:MAG: ABC transporter ATP-binding protein, partial [Firmicutes bacterium]|nr:ABC transporter ATP-binding protein [Bacillota bacterium]
ENITGIRVVKALSKKDYEEKRFDDANEAMFRSNTRASTIMALPGPVMNICLNIGLSLVVYVGATRVNSGAMKPGVILGSLTYFNIILMSVMGLNRIFMMMSKASASAKRIEEVVKTPEDQPVLPPEECLTPEGNELIRMEHVNFRYQEGDSDAKTIDGQERTLALSDLSFAVKQGESLGIIGPTGAGKSTIIQLLMRFYDVKDGGVFIDGRDVRGYEKDELRRQFGVVFQNDIIFNDTLFNNVDFGRSLSRGQVDAAVKDAMAAEFVYGLKGGLDFVAEIKGANLSGGQKQRMLIARSLAGKPRILILDDSSSALDYRTDAELRKTLGKHYQDSTLIMIAQRVSSIRSLSHILVLRDGETIGYGTHDELMESCPYYRDIAHAQMGALE